MNAAINNLTAPDAYGPTSTLDPGNWVHHFNLDVTNQAIYWSIRQASRPTDSPGMAAWGPDVYMLPGSRMIIRPYLVGLRFRAAIPQANLPAGSQQARVTLESVIDT